MVARCSPFPEENHLQYQTDHSRSNLWSVSTGPLRFILLHQSSDFHEGIPTKRSPQGNLRHAMWTVECSKYSRYSQVSTFATCAGIGKLSFNWNKNRYEKFKWLKKDVSVFITKWNHYKVLLPIYSVIVSQITKYLQYLRNFVEKFLKMSFWENSTPNNTYLILIIMWGGISLKFHTKLKICNLVLVN